jgi:hypothetical protein
MFRNELALLDLRQITRSLSHLNARSESGQQIPLR